MADTYYRVTVIYWDGHWTESYPSFDQAIVMADRRSRMAADDIGAIKLWVDEVERRHANGRLVEHVRARRLHIDANLDDAEYEWARLHMRAEHLCER